MSKYPMNHKLQVTRDYFLTMYLCILIGYSAKSAIGVLLINAENICP